MGSDKSTGNYTSPEAFKRDWLELGVKTHRESAILYDPQSIMHSWFAVNWLKDPKYHELENVKSDSSLTDDEKRFLEGIHARNRKYVLAPSKSDIEYLEEVYSQNPKEEFNAIEFEKLIKLVDVNKIKGIWLSTTDETDSDQAQHTWRKIAQATAEANMELFCEIVERCCLAVSETLA
ncbi:uncharacterized protein LOC135340358 [Halichondria panicea]|uniref:uncharacterized protein LOC135340358 n=1 Tax=Halichondria panicea TaxID=6063 RepID=UPI00312BAF79